MVKSMKPGLKDDVKRPEMVKLFPLIVHEAPAVLRLEASN
jgi:hypothetical protein